MSTPTHAGGDTLLAPRTDEAQASPPVGPAPPRMRWYWPVIAVTVAAVVVLGVWTLTQLRSIDAPVDTPVISDHDPWIQQQLRERTRAFEAQLDPWADARLHGRNQVFRTQLDPWADARLRERNQGLEAHIDPWVESRAHQAAGP